MTGATATSIRAIWRDSCATLVIYRQNKSLLQFCAVSIWMVTLKLILRSSNWVWSPLSTSLEKYQERKRDQSLVSTSTTKGWSQLLQSLAWKIRWVILQENHLHVELRVSKVQVRLEEPELPPQKAKPAKEIRKLCTQRLSNSKRPITITIRAIPTRTSKTQCHQIEDWTNQSVSLSRWELESTQIINQGSDNLHDVIAEAHHLTRLCLGENYSTRMISNSCHKINTDNKALEEEVHSEIQTQPASFTRHLLQESKFNLKLKLHSNSSLRWKTTFPHSLDEQHQN